MVIYTTRRKKTKALAKTEISTRYTDQVFEVQKSERREMTENLKVSRLEFSVLGMAAWSVSENCQILINRQI